MKKINNNNVILNNEYQKKLLKYFNYINKPKMINKIIELNKKELNNYLFDLLNCLDKSNWIIYEKLENIVNLFMSSIFPFIEDDYFQKSVETINMLINNDLLKDKTAFNFLSWIEIIIISISEDISQFPINDIILYIQQFYKIILGKLKKCNNNITGLQIISYPYSNIKFYYFIKQLISLLNYKNEELCLIQLKNINFIPAIILEEQEIQNDPFLIFHYSRLIKNKNNKLFFIINTILKNSYIPPKIIDISLAIFNILLNSIDYYDINGSLYQHQLKAMEIIDSLIKQNLDNIEELELILQYIKNNLIEFCNNVFELDLKYLKFNLNYKGVNDILSIFNIYENKKIFLNEKDINIYIEKLKDNNLNQNNNEIQVENENIQLIEILNRLKVSKKKFYNFELDGINICKKFFINPNITNLVELIKIIIEGFNSLDFFIDIKYILIFSNFMLYYINKKNKIKGRIGQYFSKIKI